MSDPRWQNLNSFHMTGNSYLLKSYTFEKTMICPIFIVLFELAGVHFLSSHPSLHWGLFHWGRAPGTLTGCEHNFAVLVWSSNWKFSYKEVQCFCTPLKTSYPLLKMSMRPLPIFRNTVIFFNCQVEVGSGRKLGTPRPQVPTFR